MCASIYIKLTLPSGVGACVGRKTRRKSKEDGAVVRKDKRLWVAGGVLLCDLGGDFMSSCFVIEH